LRSVYKRNVGVFSRFISVGTEVPIEYVFYLFHSGLWVKEADMDRACSTNRTKSNAYRIFVRQPEVKNHFPRPKRRWIGNIKMNVREIRWGCMDWIDLAQDRNQWRALVNKKTNKINSVA
jgi:hypothetical protein